MPSLHAFEQELLAAAVPRKMQRVWALNDAPNRGAAGSSAPPMRPQRDTAVPALQRADCTTTAASVSSGGRARKDDQQPRIVAKHSRTGLRFRRRANRWRGLRFSGSALHELGNLYRLSKERPLQAGALR
jgi:hypothetical protein